MPVGQEMPEQWGSRLGHLRILRFWFWSKKGSRARIYENGYNADGPKDDNDPFNSSLNHSNVPLIYKLQTLESTDPTLLPSRYTLKQRKVTQALSAWLYDLMRILEVLQNIWFDTRTSPRSRSPLAWTIHQGQKLSLWTSDTCKPRGRNFSKHRTRSQPPQPLAISPCPGYWSMTDH